MKHKHHIVPKHMGGSDDVSNIVELTIEEHAKAHQLLFEQYGHKADYLAWKGLSKLMTKREIFAEFGKQAMAGRREPTNQGKKYQTYKKSRGSTQGLRWFHNPDNPTEKVCISNPDDAPYGWASGQGRKAVNPGLNFTAKLRR